MNDKDLFFCLFNGNLFFGCNKSEQLVIEDQLATERGKPVSDAHIHFIPNLVSHSKKMPLTSIRYSLPIQSFVTLKTYSQWKNELIETLVNETKRAGSHTVSLSESLYTNRLYKYRLEVSRSTLDTMIVKEIMSNKPAEALIGVEPITKTNNNGRFEIEIGELAIGKTFDLTSTNDFKETVRISDNIELMAIKDGEIIPRKYIEVDEERLNSVVLTSQ